MYSFVQDNKIKGKKQKIYIRDFYFNPDVDFL
jgi:hypothetical protein